MAEIDRELAIAFGAQSVEGTADATIAALSGSKTLADGFVLGDPESGLFKSGISHSFERRERPPAALADSLTRQDGDFLEEVVSLSFAFPLCGNRVTTTTPVDTEFTHEKGIDGLLEACGLTGQTSATPGWKYIATDATWLTAKIFDSGKYWVIRDVLGDISFKLVPGEVAIATCTLRGIVDSAGLVAFPTIDYEEQASVNAPSVVSTATAWNSTRGFLDCTIGVTSNTEKIPDSNADVGYTIEQNERTISVDMTIKDDDADVDFTRSNLIGTTAPTDDLVFQVGANNAGSEAALSYAIECANLRVLSYTPAVAGKKAASQVSAVCQGLTDGSEFFIEFV